jgi:tetratricopeptide (TPR) repeat protein
MRERNVSAKINMTVLVILVVAALGLAVSLVAARQLRRGILSREDLQTGETAFANKDWPAACKALRRYLARNPDKVEILKKYAKACLSVRPLDAPTISGAISAYRRIMQLDPLDPNSYEKLATLYTAMGSFEELAYVGRTRLDHDPNDLKAPLWLADALIQLKKMAEAQQTVETFIDRLYALPGQRAEYVQACMRMGSIAASDDSPEAKTTALDWLNEAVSYAPESVEALAQRARFYRAMSDIPDVNEQDRLALARKDLEAADKVGTEDPRIRYSLGVEWMAHGELDRAAAELQAVDKLPVETLEQHFLDIGAWTVAKFLLASELASRKGAVAEAASLADEALASLKENRHRAQVLPVAIPLYVVAGKVPEARRSLDEYVGIVRSQQGSSSETPRRLAGLQALVAGVENKPYAAIDALEPVVGNDTSRPGLWRLLAEAYSQTDQPGRAINALNQYRRFNPQDSQAMLELARQYAKLEDWRKAFDSAQMAESFGSTDLAIELLRIGASINLTIGQRDSAGPAELKKLSAELATLRQANPDQVDIRMLQAIVADNLGQPDEAEKVLKQAIEECKEPLRAEMQLARHYFAAKRVSDAAGVCETACKRHPEVAMPWLSLSDLHVTGANYDAARRCLEQGLSAVADQREKRSLSIKLALLELVHGDRAKGASILKEMAAQDKQEIVARSLLLGLRETRMDRAATETLLGELRQAEGERGLLWRLHQASLWLSSDNWSSKQKDITTLLQYCIDADPTWSAPVLLLTGMYERLGDFRRVEDICRRALVENPSAADVADRLLTLLEGQGRFPDAEKVLAQLQVDPRVASAWQVRMAVGARDFSRAIDELRLRASNDKQDAGSRIQLARLSYQQTKNAGQALDYLKEAEAIAPGSPMLIATRASILKAEGRSEEALKGLNAYVADHNDFDGYWMRAVYLTDDGKLEPAEQDYKKLTTFAQNGATGYELLSNFYVRTDRLDRGVTAVEEGLTAYPENLRLERALMRLLFSRAHAQDREKALGILAALEKQLPQDTELMTIRALQMLVTPTPESLSNAKQILESVVKLEPMAVNAHLALIAISMREGEYKAACDYAVRALDSNPQNTTLLSARAKAELALGYTPTAAKLAREALQRDPNDAEALGVLVDGAVSGKDRSLLEEARRLVDAAISRNPTSDRLLISRSRIQAVLESPKAAIPPLETYCQTKEGSSSIGALITLADLYRLAGEADPARQWIERAEKLAPKNQAVVHARFLWLMSQNRLDELSRMVPAYLSAEGQDLTTVVQAASILTSLDSIETKKEGVKLFEHALSLAPTSIEARLGLASSLYQTGDVERAEKMYRELIAQHPDSIRALNDLAWILQERYQRYADALDLANKALRLAPGDAHLLDTRGTILSNMPERLADARRDFEELVRLSSSDTRQQAKALLQLGRLCVKLNDLPQAKQHLQTAMEIDRKTPVFTTDERAEIAKAVQPDVK